MRRPGGHGAARCGLVSLLAVLGVLGGCTVGPSHRPPVAVQDAGIAPLAPPPSPPPAGSAAPSLPPLQPGRAEGLRFQDCTEELRARLGAPVAPDRDLRFGCGTVRVGSGTAELEVVRASLGAPPAGVGVPLVVLGEPDGPPGSLRAAQLAATAPLALLRGMVLVGVDRRGAGTDEPVDCIPASVRAAVVDADPFVRDPEQLTDLLGVAERIAQSCSQVLEESLQTYDTTTAAADLERVRQALGTQRLNAVGLGGGSRVLAVYADRFPGSVGRMVLDSAPDPTLDVVGAAEQRAVASEQAFDAFAADCTARPDCPLGPDPRRALLALADRLHTQPLLAPDGRQVTAGTAFQALLSGLDDPPGWPALAQALAAAGRGDPSGVLRVASAAGADGSRFDLGLITSCNDTSQRLAPDQVAQLIVGWRQRHPLFGPLFAQRLLLCASWPVPTQPAVTGHAVGAPPILVLGTAIDPRTPLPGAQRTADQLASGLLLTWQGTGHGAYPRTPCVTEATDAFLLDGKLPRAGTVCPP